VKRYPPHPYHQGCPVVPGCMLQLALTGPEAVSEAPRAVRALWP
jgi:hypothetical protein